MSRDLKNNLPAPLRPSHVPNVLPSQAHHFTDSAHPGTTESLSNFLAPKTGAAKLKVKAGVSPEARVRVGSVPGGLRPLTPRPIKSRLMAASDAIPTPSRLGPTSHLSRGITSSDSKESLNVYQLGFDTDGQGFDTATETGLGENETVLVSVRVRPINPAEQRRGDDESVWSTNDANPQILGLGRGQAREEREWTFDRILDASADNTRAYAMSAKTHVRRAMEGYNALIFAYGQTASGKTHTLSGSSASPGIIPLAIHDLFSTIRASPDREFLLRASYLELYNETLLDLLSDDGRELSISEGRKKGEVVVNGLTECAVRTEDEVRKLLGVGEQNRKVGKTDWNARSSRSHCVFRIVIESRASKYDDGAAGTRTPGGRLPSGDRMTRISTLSIIDLAGSEKHTSSKERNAEGKHINQSLLTLKLVIGKLADMASKKNVTHVPYRDSKLTRLLQPSLSGDALISVICTLSPSPLNLNESLSTLSFAQGLKRVVLRAQRNQVLDPQALIQLYQQEIAELKAMLKGKENGAVGASNGGAMRTNVLDKGDTRMSGVTDGQKKSEMERRLEELKSMIITGGSSGDGTGSGEIRSMSPTKLERSSLGYDKTAAQLREDLHAAQQKISKLTDDNIRLNYELEARASKPDERIMNLMDEVAGLRMIADDYERNLLEPSRKVREDVQREWAGKFERLEQQLETKQIWACRLDEKVRDLTKENQEMRVRCSDAEQKVHLIIDWLNTTLSAPSDKTSESLFQVPNRPSSGSVTLPASVNQSSHHQAISRVGSRSGHSRIASVDIPELIVQAPSPFEDDIASDFGPRAIPGATTTTLTLNAKLTRDKISHKDLASLSERFGSLGVRAEKGGVRMLREESGWDLSKVAEGDGEEVRDF